MQHIRVSSSLSIAIERQDQELHKEVTNSTLSSERALGYEKQDERQFHTALVAKLTLTASLVCENLPTLSISVVKVTLIELWMMKRASFF